MAKRTHWQNHFSSWRRKNPIENEGTYNLPEAQLDRFLFKLVLEYPNQDEEKDILRLFLSGTSPYATLETDIQRVTNAEELMSMQALASRVTVDESIIDYITSIVRQTRSYPGFSWCKPTRLHQHSDRQSRACLN